MALVQQEFKEPGVADITETVSVQIEGDSTSLQEDLDQLLRQLEELPPQVAALNQGFQQTAESLGQLSGSLAPLQAMSGQLQLIAGELAALFATPVSLNVSPALGALAELNAAIAETAASLRALSGASIGGGGGGSLAGPVAAGEGFADGGLVTGPGGVDQVPAWLSAGEFVLKAASVELLGVEQLQALNQRPEVFLPRPTESPPSSTSSTVNNHYGGITVQLTPTVDLPGFLQEVHRAAAHVTVRRG